MLMNPSFFVFDKEETTETYVEVADFDKIEMVFI